MTDPVMIVQKKKKKKINIENGAVGIFWSKSKHFTKPILDKQEKDFLLVICRCFFLSKLKTKFFLCSFIFMGSEFHKTDSMKDAFVIGDISSTLLLQLPLLQ